MVQHCFFPPEFNRKFKTAKEALDILRRDLPRTPFISAKYSRRYFDKTICQAIYRHQHYSQGDLDGRIFAKLLLLNSSYSRLITDNADEMKTQELMNSDRNGIAFSYIDDCDKLCGASINVISSSPNIFTLSIIRGLDKSPKQKQVLLIGYSLIFNHYEKGAVLNRKEIRFTAIEETFLKKLNNQSIASKLKGFIGGQGIDIEKLRYFKTMLQAGKNLSYYESNFLNSKKTKIEATAKQFQLKLLAKLCLDKKSYLQFEQQFSLKSKKYDDDFEKKINHINQLFSKISSKLPQHTKNILNSYSQRSTQRNNRYKAFKDKNKNFLYELYLSQPYSRRFKQQLIGISIGLTLTSIGAGLFFAAVISPASLGILLYSAMIALTVLSLGISISSWVGKTFSEYQYQATFFSYQKNLDGEQVKDEKETSVLVKTIDEGTLTTIFKASLQSSSKSQNVPLANKPIEVVSDYFKP